MHSITVHYFTRVSFVILVFVAVLEEDACNTISDSTTRVISDRSAANIKEN